MVRWLAVHATVMLHAIALTIAIALVSQLRADQPILRLSFNRRPSLLIPPALSLQEPVPDEPD
jgi:hypothetical protein